MPPAETKHLRTLSIAIVPDSFKGSAGAGTVAQAMARGARTAARAAGREVAISTLPFADGGEGTLDAILDAWDIPARSVATTDALGRDVAARYGLSPDGSTAVIEAAEANGLPAVSDVPLRPLHATTFGIGALVNAALDAGATEIVLCIGGSATTDGGTGLLSALGARFLDRDGHELPPGGGSLRDLASIDVSALDRRALGVSWKIACDVTNPLVGERGAAAVFGPQKGARTAEIDVLDAGLRRLAVVIGEATGRQLGEVPGMGAAGGLAACLAGFCEVELVPGWELVAQILDAREILGTADLVLTGEGRLDSQSLHGKVVNGVRLASRPEADVIVIAGSIQLGPDELAQAGILAAYSISPGPATLEELSGQAEGLIESTSYSVVRTYLANGQPG
ncbi:glycerate kinase [Paeniglutamicibacter sp. ABSL32-1]|uniref:glycerate kinase family protein n=1 Tax=Paeniglutamicibacter quisquiliarum TaxID=2849498 RepID=UPI001C2DA6C6|nr:glycerate kinase [Paeniglutamicibacter quisquiliarum]MBV1777711.1 glycerate kinase [Paeniglutamicibacter quisquiliarum]